MTSSGNLVGGQGLSWNAENQLSQVQYNQTTETYAYDADGERVKRLVDDSSPNTKTTYYIGGMYEKDAETGTTRTMYQFNGQVIAQRTITTVPTNTLVYLHSDHLGSVSAATSSTGAVLSRQSYDPWGKVRSQTGTSQTKVNYTGQKLDDSGLLYYHARYYDPSLARFASPDSIVPGASSGVGGAGGTVGMEQNSKLTVDFHEGGFLTGVQGENQPTLQKGFWFQLSGEDKQKAREPWGPVNPQALNRYSYVLDNPLRYVDPTGHTMVTGLKNIRELRKLIARLIKDPQNWKTILSLPIAAGVGIAGVPLGGWIGVLYAAGTALAQSYGNDRLDEYISFLQALDSQLKIVDDYYGDSVDDDPNAWVGIWLDVNGPNCSWCLVSTNSVTNGKDNPGGRTSYTSIASWVWFGLYDGSVGLQVTLLPWGGGKPALKE